MKKIIITSIFTCVAVSGMQFSPSSRTKECIRRVLMPEDEFDIKRMRAPHCLQRQFDAVLSKGEAGTFVGAGVSARVAKYPEIPGWVLKKMRKDRAIESIKYSEELRQIVHEGQFKHIIIPQQYFYTFAEHSFVIAEEIDESATKKMRDVSFDEACDLLFFIIRARYEDAHTNNIIITDRGFAFIDTEPRRFFDLPIPAYKFSAIFSKQVIQELDECKFFAPLIERFKLELHAAQSSKERDAVLMQIYIA